MEFIRTGPYLVFGLFCGAMSYMRTMQYRRMYGRSPWGIHPIIWGLVSVPIVLLGTVLSIIACSRGGSRVYANRSNPQAYGGVPQERGPGYGAPTPGIGQSNAWPQAAGANVPASWGQPPQVAPALAASWVQDPTGRHELRYFDGSKWTEHVSNQGQTSIDPI
ncbi:MAG: DUF2510 domain-containing protein [Acidimicrobiales bacterium]